MGTALLKIRIEKPIKTQAATHAKLKGRTLSQHVRELIRADLERPDCATLSVDFATGRKEPSIREIRTEAEER